MEDINLQRKTTEGVMKEYYEGQERRKENINIAQWLERLDQKQEELNDKQAELKNSQTELKILQQKDLDVAEDWRRQFCVKLDKLLDIVMKLPCPERAEITKGIKEQFRLVWLFIIGIIGAIIAEWIKQ